MANDGLSRFGAFGWVCLAYLLGGAGALVLAYSLEPGSLGVYHALWVAALADGLATLVVFGFSVVFDNSSFYDAYWSVAPIAVGAYWLLSPGGPALQSGRPWIVLGLICLWGLRLTFNWARGWSGLSHEDWRYVDIRARSKKLYWPASFLGIHFMPSTIVFFGLVAVYPALRADANPLGPIDLAACLVTLAAIVMEATADQQLREFLLARPAAGSLMETGLWRYSRHPNYFGEICFWWGLFLFGLAADLSWWWAIAAPLAMTCLFLFISLPLIEARMLKRRPGYPERKRTTSLLLPLPPKKS